MNRSQRTRVTVELMLAVTVGMVGVLAGDVDPALWVSFGLVLFGVAVVELGLWQACRPIVAPLPPPDWSWRGWATRGISVGAGLVTIGALWLIWTQLFGRNDLEWRFTVLTVVGLTATWVVESRVMSRRLAA